jgi:hypothetical protein
MAKAIRQTMINVIQKCRRRIFVQNSYALVFVKYLKADLVVLKSCEEDTKLQYELVLQGETQPCPWSARLINVQHMVAAQMYHRKNRTVSRFMNTYHQNLL